MKHYKYQKSGIKQQIYKKFISGPKLCYMKNVDYFG